MLKKEEDLESIFLWRMEQYQKGDKMRIFMGIAGTANIIAYLITLFSNTVTLASLGNLIIGISLLILMDK